jgi:hypothetical protein
MAYGAYSKFSSIFTSSKLGKENKCDHGSKGWCKFLDCCSHSFNTIMPIIALFNFNCILVINKGLFWPVDLAIMSAKFTTQ